MAKMIRRKVKLLEDVDARYISLVDRGANRIPFRMLKSEDGSGAPTDLELSEKRQHALDVQTVVLAKEHFGTLNKAKTWLTEHGYSTEAITESDGSFRAVQFDAQESEKAEFQMVEPSQGVMLVLCHRAVAKADKKKRPRVPVLYALDKFAAQVAKTSIPPESAKSLFTGLVALTKNDVKELFASERKCGPESPYGMSSTLTSADYPLVDFAAAIDRFNFGRDLTGAVDLLEEVLMSLYHNSNEQDPNAVFAKVISQFEAYVQGRLSAAAPTGQAKTEGEEKQMDMEKLVKDLEVAIGRIATLEAKLAERSPGEEKLAALGGKVAALESTVASRQEVSSVLNGRIETLEQKFQEFGAIKEALTQAQKAVADLTKKLEDQRLELVPLKERVERAETRVGKVENRLTETEGLTSRDTKRVDAMENRIAKAEDKASNQSETIEHIKKYVASPNGGGSFEPEKVTKTESKYGGLSLFGRRAQ